jgi:hypothetical protein
MAVETIGEALSYGWRLTARCAAGKQDGMHRHKECVYRAELDMETLVWTRGRGFPLSRLESRLRCPHCGSRDVQLSTCRRQERASDRAILMQAARGGGGAKRDALASPQARCRARFAQPPYALSSLLDPWEAWPYPTYRVRGRPLGRMTFALPG